MIINIIFLFHFIFNPERINKWFFLVCHWKIFNILSIFCCSIVVLILKVYKTVKRTVLIKFWHSKFIIYSSMDPKSVKIIILTIALMVLTVKSNEELANVSKWKINKILSHEQIFNLICIIGAKYLRSPYIYERICDVSLPHGLLIERDLICERICLIKILNFWHTSSVGLTLQLKFYYVLE